MEAEFWKIPVSTTQRPQTSYFVQHGWVLAFSSQSLSREAKPRSVSAPFLSFPLHFDASYRVGMFTKHTIDDL